MAGGDAGQMIPCTKKKVRLAIDADGVTTRPRAGVVESVSVGGNSAVRVMRSEGVAIWCGYPMGPSVATPRSNEPRRRVSVEWCKV